MHPESRYARVSRRTVLRGAAGAGAALALPGLVACSSTADDITFAGATVEDGNAPTTTTPADTATTTTADASPADTTTSEAAPPAADSGVIGVVTVGFTYAQGQGGKDLPPYIAVWIEDANGDFVDTVALWYEQSQKGPRWLNDLRRWFSLAGSSDYDTISSATRLPGAYTVVWDASSLDAGSYHVCIESARERGPYSLIRQPVDLPTGGAISLPDEGELVAASVVTA